MHLSIIIVNWNTCEVTCNCIQSVYEQTKEFSFEVIVIDNASSDRSVMEINKNFPEVIIIQNKNNLGFASANNQGIEIAKGKYILLLNSDTIVLDNALEKTIQFAESHPEAGLVGCKILNPDKTLQRSCFMHPSLLNMFISTLYLNQLFTNNKFFGRERMTWWDHNDTRYVEAIMGAFMLTRREALNEVGMMDNSFFMYAEETDWCYRFDKAGWKVIFTPDAEIIHLGGQSSKQVKPLMILQLRAGILQFIRKHHNSVYYYAACLITYFWFSVRIVPWLITGLINPSERKKSHQMVKTYFIGSIKSLLGYKSLECKIK